MKKFFSRIMHRPHLPRLFGRLAAPVTLAVLALSVLLSATGSAQAAASQASACARNDLQCVITAGDLFIKNRQTVLTGFSGKVATQLNEKHITGDQANMLQADVTTNQNGLATLKAKLDAEKSILAARQDVLNIFVQFRIYGVVLPRDYRHLYFDILVNLDGKLRSVEPQIEQAIAKAPPSKQPELNQLLADYKTQLGTAEAQFDSAQADFPELTPSNYNYNRSSYLASLANLKTDLQTAHTALAKAANDLHHIAQILKQGSK